MLSKHKKLIITLLIAAVYLTGIYTPLAIADIDKPEMVTSDDFVELLQNPDPTITDQLVQKLDQHWSASLTPMLLETINYVPSSYARSQLLVTLSEKTGQTNLNGLHDWYSWLWNQPENLTSDYADFKASLYRLIDLRFGTYFRNRQDTAQIRLDEIRWGGVGQDGIPPLRNPTMLKASEADYLEDDNIVFGVDIDGDVRAYPKRILAWHEMFTDTFGEGDKQQAIAGVYCTLCGTVIIYKTEHDGIAHQLGTSGFLYRSNKLMYDKATQSMWSTVRGEPVLGPLVGQGIALEHLSVVTTTWKEWQRRHPDTLVLSLDTGHQRDYGEGIAYQEYFATDQLMFNTPFEDKRLKNKREVLALRFTAAPNQQLAISTEYLNNNPIFSDQIGPQKFVVLTDKTGANRVYDPLEIKFAEYDGLDTVIDTSGKQWKVNEQSITAIDGQTLNRLPYHRAFWFGWHAAFPDTKLIK